MPLRKSETDPQSHSRASEKCRQLLAIAAAAAAAAAAAEAAAMAAAAATAADAANALAAAAQAAVSSSMAAGCTLKKYVLRLQLSSRAAAAAATLGYLELGYS
mmetsp:Transcript_18691/g.47756  ORF Transcript_18691/g.47756 Transcript_18691/m.47756 type:complete len:103 (-) Transcript_18691:767-1075(-)